jgi:hypothetical protein
MNTGKMFFLCAIAALSAHGVRAADAPGAACALLTQAEIEAATGFASGAGNPADQELPASAADPGQHAMMYTCLWAVPAVHGQLVVGMGPAPAGGDAKTLSRQNVGMDALRKQHYTEESKDFGDISCSGMSPPASAAQGLGMSYCGAIVSGKFLSVTSMGPSKRLTLDQVKSLLDKAIRRAR